MTNFMPEGFQSPHPGLQPSTGDVPWCPYALRERHHSLFFNDGTVILATPTVLFRIYGGILAHHSLVFNDMLSMPQPSTSTDQNTLDGIPIVDVHDDPKHLAHLLSAIFYQGYYNSTAPAKFEVVASILLLSTKYQMQSLRIQAIQQLSTICPDTLEALNQNAISPEKVLIQEYDAFQMVAVARRAEAPQLLPYAFYRLANSLTEIVGSQAPLEQNQPWMILLKGLTAEDITRVCFGRERLQRAFREDFVKFFYEGSPDICLTHVDCVASKKRTSLRRKPWAHFNQESDVLKHKLISQWAIALEAGGMCAVCLDILRKSMDDCRMKVWAKLPSYFSLPEWDVLRRATDLAVTYPESS